MQPCISSTQTHRTDIISNECCFLPEPYQILEKEHGIQDFTQAWGRDTVTSDLKHSLLTSYLDVKRYIDWLAGYPGKGMDVWHQT